MSNLTAINGTAAAVVQAIDNVVTDPANFNDSELTENAQPTSLSLRPPTVPSMVPT